MDIPFKPAWWLPGPHLQTLWPALFRKKNKKHVKWERLNLPDGDFLDLTWLGEGNGPIVIVLHGLNGSLDSRYAAGILNAIKQQGFRAVLMHFRGCSGVPNILSRSYHSGETGDLNFVANTLLEREPSTPLLAVGFSLGGNVLLKWLGETGGKNPLRAAVAVSVPFELAKTANHLSTGFSQLYQRRLVQELNRAFLVKFKKLPRVKHLMESREPRTFWEFDDAVTAPLHGFKNAEEYYRLSSCRQFLAKIQIPTLIIHARNDPFTPLAALPDESEVSEKVTLEYTSEGGHVGFVAGQYPWKPIYWLDQRIIQFLIKK